MRRFRIFLFVMLSLAVPLQGFAHFAQIEAHCEMDQTAQMDAADASSEHDCCDDGNATGNGCKSGQPCQSTGQHFSVATFDVLLVDTTPATRFPRIAVLAPSFDPSATWRPPAYS